VLPLQIIITCSIVSGARIKKVHNFFGAMVVKLFICKLNLKIERGFPVLLRSKLTAKKHQQGVLECLT
jgi:hypothetical protein